MHDFREVGKMTHGRKWKRVKEDEEQGWRLSEEETLNLVIKEIGD